MTNSFVARRAVIRWAWRLYRREWRRHILVMALLVLVVVAAVGFGSGVYNAAGVSDDAEFGNARQLLRYDAPDRRTLQADVAAAEEQFGVVELITHWEAAVPGSTESLEFRAQDIDGPLSGPTLAVRDGRAPSRVGELAVTDDVATTFQLDIGDEFALDGTERTVVGLVENPSDLGAEFALVFPTDDASPQSVTLLVESADETQPFRAPGWEQADGERASRDQSDAGTAVAVAVLGTAATALLLVALVATASFATVAQRRLHQLGMLGAVGATEKHLRLVVVANGAVIGVVAALIGGASGIAAWLAIAPRMENAVGHRIDRLNVPWWLVGITLALVVVATVAAAWWPARAMARVPVTRALSGRPPISHPAHRSALLAGLLIVIGLAALASADRRNDLLIVIGTVATVSGVLLISPLAVRTLAAAARWRPVATRLALRDLVRYQSRSAVALAAISLALGIPVAIVLTATAGAQTADQGNLSDRQLMIWTRDAEQPEGVSPFYSEDPDDQGFAPYLPRLSEADLEEREATVTEIVATFDEATVDALEVAVDPDLAVTPDGRLAVTLAQQTEGFLVDVALLYVATPELLEHYGVDLDGVEPGTEVLTVPPHERLPEEIREKLETDALWFANTAERGPSDDTRVLNERSLESGYSSLPGSFITPEGLRRRGWEQVRIGWLVETATAPTAEQLATAREMASDADLLIESRQNQPSLADLRWRATGAGLVVALGVLAMTVGLIRNEAVGDLRMLAATGATSGIRRRLTAATAAGLALLGAALGAAGAYLCLAAGYLRDLDALTSVPVAQLAIIFIGVPAVAAMVGWLTGGREPTTLARQPIE